jgi:hypothetical protein
MRQQLGHRLERLESWQQRASIRYIAHHLARHLGLDEDVLASDMEATLEHCQHAGLIDAEAMLHYLADEAGLSPATLQAEADALGELLP